MYSQIDTMFLQGVLNLGNKNAIAPNLRERYIRDAIAGGTNLQNLNLKIRPSPM
jgi:hypothetical protein